MARSVASLSIAIIFFCRMFFFPFLSTATSQCNEPYRTLDDSGRQLISINGKCNDDPDIGTNICPDVVPHICIGRGGGGEGGFTPSSETIISLQTHLSTYGVLINTAKLTFTCGQNSYPTCTCFPPGTSSTKAKLTNNDFSEGGDGGAPSECDGKYQDNSNPLVALSTEWTNAIQCEDMTKNNHISHLVRMILLMPSQSSSCFSTQIPIII